MTEAFIISPATIRFILTNNVRVDKNILGIVGKVRDAEVEDCDVAALLIAKYLEGDFQRHVAYAKNKQEPDYRIPKLESKIEEIIETAVARRGFSKTNFVFRTELRHVSYAAAEITRKYLEKLEGFYRSESTSESTMTTHVANPGYHVHAIAKGELGEISKIREELDELIDAHAQSVKIMELVELSDMIGAIEAFLEKHHTGTSLADLIAMKDVTQRAFVSGRRSSTPNNSSRSADQKKLYSGPGRCPACGHGDMLVKDGILRCENFLCESRKPASAGGGGQSQETSSFSAPNPRNDPEEP